MVQGTVSIFSRALCVCVCVCVMAMELVGRASAVRQTLEMAHIHHHLVHSKYTTNARVSVPCPSSTNECRRLGGKAQSAPRIAQSVVVVQCGLVLPRESDDRLGRSFHRKQEIGFVKKKRSSFVVNSLEADAEGAEESDRKDDGSERTKLAVFVSGGGSNFRAIHAGCLSNVIHGDVAFVVSDKPGCRGCDYARDNNIPILAYPKGKNAPEGIMPSELVQSLRHAGVEYILLAGYLRLLPSELVHAYPRAILNVHPALLPSFGGKGFFGTKVHEAVICSGARYSGATIHFVDEKYDSGPILAQRVVRVLVDDKPSDLAARVLKEEHQMYTESVAALCEDRIFWREDGVPIIRKSWDKEEYL